MTLSDVLAFEVRATGEAAKNYDFIAARGHRKTTNLVESIGHLVKSSLGGGVAAIHEAYKECGIWTALFLNIILGLIISYCMHMLCKSAQRMYGRVQVPIMTYPDLAEASLAVGPWKCLRRYSRAFRYTVDFILIVDLFGACCIYQVIVARALKQLVDRTDDVVDNMSPPLRVYILVLLLPSILLCMITTLKYLAPFSLVSDVFILTIAINAVYYGMTSSDNNPVNMPIIKSFPGVMELIGVCVFSMEGIGAVLIIENNMSNPKNIHYVLFGGMAIVVCVVTTIGFFGYMGFGEKSMAPITVNFPWEHFPVMLKVFMALMVYITFALNFWISFELIWYYIKVCHDQDSSWLWERVYRAIFVSLITTVAFLLPNITKFIGLVGSLCVSNIAFIFPALIQLSLDWEDPGLGLMCWRLWRASIIIILGAALCVIGTYSNCKELILELFFKQPVVFFL